MASDISALVLAFRRSFILVVTNSVCTRVLMPSPLGMIVMEKGVPFLPKRFTPRLLLAKIRTRAQRVMPIRASRMVMAVGAEAGQTVPLSKSLSRSDPQTGMWEYYSTVYLEVCV